MQGIYKITIADKFYYGQSVNLDKRRSDHLSALKHSHHENPYMQNCFNKYMDFTFEVIEEVEDISLLDAREQHYIDLYFDRPDCMNINSIASKPPNRQGSKLSSEVKDNMSKLHLIRIKHNERQVQAILPDGTVKVWRSASEADRELGLKRCVARWCLGKTAQPGTIYKYSQHEHVWNWTFSYR